MRPADAHYNHETGLVRLFYDSEVYIDADVRGAICWPTMTEYLVNGVMSADIAGYALVGAYDVSQGRLYIAEQQRFSTISNLLGPDGLLKHKGLARWFVETAWAQYYCDTFAWANQEDFLAKKYRLEASNDPTLHPAPQFVRVPVASDSPAVWTWIKHNRLVIPAKTQLQSELMTAKSDMKQESRGLIALHALLNLVTYYDTYPPERGNQ